MVIGGGQIYEETLPLASRIYLTEVHASPEGDTRFPELDPAEWHEIRREPPVRSEEHTSELQSLMRISYAVFCLKKKNRQTQQYRIAVSICNTNTTMNDT